MTAIDQGFVETNGAKLYYEIEGRGDPLLLIHGGLGSLRMWDEQVPAFAERYRVIRYDTRGFGRTETEDVAFTNVDDAIAVLDHASARSAYVVGQSRGGMIGLDLVIAHPDRVGAFVHVASGIGGFRPELPEGTSKPPWDEMERFWKEKGWDELGELETRVWVDGWGQPPTRIPELRERVKGWILENYRAEKAEGKPRALTPPAAERLGEIRIPLLVMTGLIDEPGSDVVGRHLAASVAGARVVEFPGVAHMIHLEEPERFTRLVLDFLAGVDRKS